jgi:hypothetical protein
MKMPGFTAEARTSPAAGRYGSRLRPPTPNNAVLPQMIKVTKYETDDGDTFTTYEVTDITSQSGEFADSDVSIFGSASGGDVEGYGFSYTKSDAWWARVNECINRCEKQYGDKLIACGGEDNIERCETKASIVRLRCITGCGRNPG